ncbi:MAG: cytochrome c1 [Pseudomonadales bacterium]
MGAFVIVAVLSFLPLKVVGAESGYACGTMECDEFKANLHDKASLQSGAQVYFSYCAGCHSLKYGRYERVANDLDIPAELALENMVFDNSKIGELMEIAMQEEGAKKWFGVAPPDLTLVARLRSPEWLYTYLRNFYIDPSRPWGVNNRVFKDVGMPHALLELQGATECALGPAKAANGGIKRDILTGEDILEEHCGRLKITEPGKLSEDEFDSAVYNLVNFLEYMGEPMTVDRQRIGIYVMLFLGVFLVFAYLLNREYWKDVH